MENENYLPIDNGFIPFTSDYGFKVTFGNENDTRFLRKALQALICSPHKIVHITFDKNDFIGLTDESRSGIYDLSCIDETGAHFIVEMQISPFRHFIERMKFYALHKFNTMVKQGKYMFDNIAPIYCIGILSHNIFLVPDYHNIGKLRNDKGFVMDSSLTYVTVELGKFHLTADEVSTDLEKLIFTMKNINNYNDMPITQYPTFWTEEWLDIAIKELDTRQFTPEQYYQYNKMLVQNAMAIEIARQEREKSRLEGKEKGRLEGKEEGRLEGKEEGRLEGEMTTKRNSVIRLIHLAKLTDEEIAIINDAPLEFVQQIRAELGLL